jgi:hypothetical protein
VNLMLNNMNLVNDGHLTLGNFTNLQFLGTTPLQIGGTGTTSLFTVVLGMSSGGLTLNQDIGIRGPLDMVTGVLHLNGHTLDLGTAGYIAGERNVSYIEGASGGMVTTTQPFVANTPNNPGNIGAQLMISGPSGASVGTYTIQRTHVPRTLANSQTSIQRVYNITGNPPASLDYRLTLSYLNGELNGLDASLARIWMNNGSSKVNPFVELGADINDNASIVGMNHVTSLGIFAIGPDGAGGIILPGGSNAINAPNSRRYQDSLADNTFPVVKVFPNPAHDHFTLELTSSGDSRIHLDLYDQSGRLLQQKDIDCHTGTNILEWDISRYPQGSYFLSTGSQERKSIRIIKI